MDGIIQIGPLALATDRLLGVVTVWAFVSIGAVVAARTGTAAGRSAWIALGAGLLAARLGFVLQNLSAFRMEPWTVLALWQGGFSVWIGIAAAALTLVVMLGRHRATPLMLTALGTLSLVHVAAVGVLSPDPRPLPDGLSFVRFDGGAIRLDEFRGRPLVINLWATWCPPCRREMPMLVDVARSSPVPILLANQGERSEQVSAFLSAQGLNSDAVVLDPSQGVAAAVDVKAYPTTLFVDAAGSIVRVHAGEISRAALSAALRDLERNSQ